jgi:hypothetical protein
MPNNFIDRFNEVFPSVQGALTDYMDAQAPVSNAGAVNPLTDIDPYRVNPYRGYLAQNGGYMRNPNIEKLFLGKLIKGVGKGLAGIGKGLFKGWKGIGDFALSSLGMPNVINNSLVDNSGFLTGVTGALGKITPVAANLIVPGSGIALSAGANLINNATYGEKDKNRKEAPGIFNTIGTIGSLAGMGLGSLGGGLANSLGSLGQRLAGNSSFVNALGNLGSNQALMGGVGMLGNSLFQPTNSSTGNLGNLPGGLPFPTSLPGIGGFDLSASQANPYVSTFGRSLFRPEQGKFGGRFSDGGIVGTGADLVPVQTEMYKNNREIIVTPDMNIVEVNASKAHEKMGDEDITDLVPNESYVASSRPRMNIKTTDLEQAVIGYQSVPYKVDEVGTPPVEITAASILPKGTKKILPSDYARLIKKKYPTANREDIFAERTDDANLLGRVPYVEALVALGEANRVMVENPETFKNGGAIKMNEGGFLDFLSILGTATPLIGGLLGDNRNRVPQQNLLDPTSEALMMSSFPLSTLGIINNVRAQQGSIDNALGNLEGLTQQQMSLNNAGTMAGVAATMMQDTNIPLINQDFSRLQNFNTATPQSFINAAAVPTMDMTAYIDRLGGRGAASALASQQANMLQARNNAAMQAFGQDRSLQFNIANALTQGMNQQEVMNNQILQQRMAARNNNIGNIGSQLQGNLQNRSNLLSNAFTAGTQLDMQRAMLSGQIPAAIGQQLMNLGATRQAFMTPQTGGGVPTQASQAPVNAYDPNRLVGNGVTGITNQQMMDVINPALREQAISDMMASYTPTPLSTLPIGMPPAPMTQLPTGIPYLGGINFGTGG